MIFDYLNCPIFIIGLPRSGTSMIAGALKVCGAWVGTTSPGTTANPKGFFEHIVMREQVLKALLIQSGCDPLGVNSLPAMKLNIGAPNLSEVMKQIIKLDGYVEDKPWLYKGVKMTLLWPLFVEAFPHARWVIVKRDASDIIKSCLRTSFMKQHSTDPKFWENFVTEYLVRIQSLKKTGPIYYEIQAESIVRGDFDPFRELVSNLGLRMHHKMLQEFISPNLWHGEVHSSLNRAD